MPNFFLEWVIYMVSNIKTSLTYLECQEEWMNPSAVGMFHCRVHESWEIFPVNKILACYSGYFCRDYESLYPLEAFYSIHLAVFPAMHLFSGFLPLFWKSNVMTEICSKIRQRGLFKKSGTQKLNRCKSSFLPLCQMHRI